MRLHDYAYTTLIADNLDDAVSAYQALGLRCIKHDQLPAEQALELGYSALQNARSTWLGNESAFLRVVEYRDAKPQLAFSQLGWLASEWLVRDVHALHRTLQSLSAFRVIQAPTPLDFSDQIVAMQVQGPCDEVLYLTEVKAPVPPFRLPLSTSLTDPVGSAFVSILACTDRTAAAAFYQGLGGKERLQFETRLGALNAERGWNAERKHPLATVAFQGDALLELDQLELSPQPADVIQKGILSVAIRRVGTRAQAGPRRVLRGPSNELIELV
jgi:hypothetical protein